MLEGVDTPVLRDGDHVRYTGRLGPVDIELDPAGDPARISVAGVTAERVDGEVPTPEPVDPARLLAIPAPPSPRARRSHVGRFRVDGVEVVVEAPTWAELPAERERVRALVDEVADRIDPAFVPGRRSGASALAAGQGDCTEHALALVERARAEGFEARTAAGRVYVDTPEPSLVLHAWAEVKLGDRWVAADPALRQLPADASHLRLGEWIADLAAADGRTVTLVDLR